MKQTPEIGAVYEITRSRNILVGVWTGAVWIGVREKCGSRFLDACEMPRFVEFGKVLGKVPDSIPLRTDLGSFDRRTGRACSFKQENQDGTGWWYDSATGSRLDRNAEPWAKANTALFNLLVAYESRLK